MTVFSASSDASGSLPPAFADSVAATSAKAFRLSALNRPQATASTRSDIAQATAGAIESVFAWDPLGQATVNGCFMGTHGDAGGRRAPPASDESAGAASDRVPLALRGSDFDDDQVVAVSRRRRVVDRHARAGRRRRRVLTLHPVGVAVG